MAKVGRNDPCPCGSGKKYKKCCQPIAEHIQKALGSTDTIIPLQAFAEGNDVDTAIARACYSTETIDLITFRTTDLVLLKNLTETTRAIEMCVSRKYLNSALKLIYAAIDNLAYLATNRQTVSKPDFIKWVNTFLLPTSNLSCTAEELYAQRLSRYTTAMRNGMPDRVPMRPFAAEITARYAGYTCQEVSHDYRKAFEAVIR